MHLSIKHLLHHEECGLNALMLHCEQLIVLIYYSLLLCLTRYEGTVVGLQIIRRLGLGIAAVTESRCTTVTT